MFNQAGKICSIAAVGSSTVTSWMYWLIIGTTALLVVGFSVFAIGQIKKWIKDNVQKEKTNDKK